MGGERHEEHSGACGKEDEHAMAKKGSGHHKGSFPWITSDCGKASYSVWWGFNKKDFAKCVRKDVPGMTKPCAKCMAKHANYMTDNCKWACMTNWCSAGCLSCSANDNKAIKACTGKKVKLPTTNAC